MRASWGFTEFWSNIRVILWWHFNITPLCFWFEIEVNIKRCFGLVSSSKMQTKHQKYLVQVGLFLMDYIGVQCEWFRHKSSTRYFRATQCVQIVCVWAIENDWRGCSINRSFPTWFCLESQWLIMLSWFCTASEIALNHPSQQFIWPF